jgi:hypothetical protein
MKGLTWYNSVNLTGLENIVSLKKKFKMKFLKNIETETYLIDLGQYRLTCQIRNLDHETKITPQKANQSKS